MAETRLPKSHYSQHPQTRLKLTVEKCLPFTNVERPTVPTKLSKLGSTMAKLCLLREQLGLVTPKKRKSFVDETLAVGSVNLYIGKAFCCSPSKPSMIHWVLNLRFKKLQLPR